MIGAPGANYIVQTLKYASTLTSNLAAPEAASLSFCFLFGVLIFVFAFDCLRQKELKLQWPICNSLNDLASAP